MQEMKLNYLNVALSSKCFELCTENCISGLIDRISWESQSFMVEICMVLHGGGGCRQLCSSVLKQSLCSMSAVQEHVCQGIGGTKVGRGTSCLSSHLCHYLNMCLTKWW